MVEFKERGVESKCNIFCPYYSSVSQVRSFGVQDVKIKLVEVSLKAMTVDKRVSNARFRESGDISLLCSFKICCVTLIFL